MFPASDCCSRNPNAMTPSHPTRRSGALHHTHFNTHHMMVTHFNTKNTKITHSNTQNMVQQARAVQPQLVMQALHPAASTEAQCPLHPLRHNAPCVCANKWRQALTMMLREWEVPWCHTFCPARASAGPPGSVTSSHRQHTVC